MKAANLRFLKNMRFKSYQALFLVVGILFGVLVTAQWHSLPSRVTNPVTPYTSLKDTRDLLLSEQDQLKTEIENNQKDINKYQQALKSGTIDKTKLASLDSAKEMAGVTKLSGPGAAIILDDSKQGAVSDESIVHASDLRDTVNLLWGAGAEGISINNERVVTGTSIDCIVNTILVNSTRLAAPFKIEAVGNQRLMLSELNNHMNLSEIYKRQSSHGLIFTFSEINSLTLNPYTGSFDQPGGTN